MSISTIANTNKKSKFMGILLYVSAVLVALGIMIAGRFIFTSVKKLNGKAALTVDVANGRATVFVNDEEVGVTPFESEEIKPGDNKVTIKSTERQYETTLKFLPNNDRYIHQTSVFRDLGISELFSSGQDLWFDEDNSGTVLRIISEPSGASVFIDGTEIGKTPYTSSKLSEGDYDLMVERTGYESQKTRIRIQKGYIYNVSMKLFPMPVPSRVSPFEGSENLYDISSDNDKIISDPNTWVKAVVYWNQTRGINLEGVGLNKDLVFDYYIDYSGDLYNAYGDRVTDLEIFKEQEEYERGAYMGRISDREGLTQAATDTFNLLTTGSTETDRTVTILPTGTGWLRVRNAAGINGVEVARVDVGSDYVLLEEQDEWVKITVSENQDGWVSKTYVEINESE